VQLERCPYDSTPVDAETMSGGSILISCSCCGAQWEWHNAWLHRIADPDKDAIRAARGRSSVHESQSD